jgi:hypothetical protein
MGSRPECAGAVHKTAPAELENDALPPGDKVPHRDVGTRRSGLLRGWTHEREPGWSTSHGGPGSMLIGIVQQAGISFHAEPPGKSRSDGALGINAGWPCFARGSV